MSKYTPQDVVKIKRDIQSLSIEIADKSSQCKKVNEELASLNLLLSTTREKVKKIISNLSLSYGKNMDILNAEKVSLEGEIIELQDSIVILRNERSKEVQSTQREISSLRDIRKKAEENKKNAVTSAELAALELSVIMKQLNDEKVVLDSVLNRKSVEQDAVEKLKTEERLILSRISVINDQMEKDYAEGRQKNKKLEEERDHLRRQIADARGWERDVKAMEARLSPKYQEVFNRLPKKKK